MEDSEATSFVQRLQLVLRFLQDNGFEKAASAVYEQLEDSKSLGPEEERCDDQQLENPEYAAEEEDQACNGGDYRSRSADPVLVSSRGPSETADDGQDTQTDAPWPPGAAEGLQKRLSGSSRLYEDPDVDEYNCMDDVGYVRHSISNQQDFIMHQLDILQDGEVEAYFHSSSMQYAGGGSSSQHNPDESPLSRSGSSSASLSSPAMSSCAQQHHPSGSTSQGGQDPHLPDLTAAAARHHSASTGDTAWDSGPAGITFAEPVTTPTKDSCRSSINDEAKPSLSRVESLSNSFIDELESWDGNQGMMETTSAQLSEAGSTAGDLGTPPRRSRAGGAGSSSDACGGSGRDEAAADADGKIDNVIDLSPPSPPPECAADAGIDLSNIFELGLRASSRTSSVDVLQGSVRCWSEADSDSFFGQQQQQLPDWGRPWSQSAAVPGGSNVSSRAGSSVGSASLGPGGLVLGKAKQSAGLSRLQQQQSARQQEQQEPEQERDQQHQRQQQQQQQSLLVQQQQDPRHQQQAEPEVQQTQEQQQHLQLDLQPTQNLQQQEQRQPELTPLQQPPPPQQPEQQHNALLVLSPTQQELKQPEAHAADQQQQWLLSVSESGSSSSAAAAPNTPTGAVPAAAAVAGGGSSDASAAADVASDTAAADAVGSPVAATAAAGGGGGGGFGFTFPTTPPSAADAAVHEERAERVFSTWASNHSRSLSGALDFDAAAGGGSDDEADTSSSKPSTPAAPAGSDTTAPAAAAAGGGSHTSPWDFPSTSAAAGTGPGASDETAAAAAGSSSARSSSHDAVPDKVTLAPPVTPVDTPFSAGAALAAALATCSKSSSPAGKASGSRGASRAHSSSSAAAAAVARAAAAAAAGGGGGSSRSSSQQLSAAGRQQQWGSGAGAAGSGSTGALRSPLGEGRLSGGGAGGRDPTGLMQQQGSMGYGDSLGDGFMAGMDTDAASTGGFSGSGDLAAPRYVIDEAGNLLYEYDAGYVENRYEVFELRIIHRRRRTGFEDSKEFPIRKNDLIAGRYQVMDFLGSAAFSQAVQAVDTATGALVCLKIIKNNKDYFDQSLDEIKLLRYVNGADPNDEHHIVRLYDFFYYKEHLFLVCELLRANLYEFQKYQRENGDEPYFTPPRIQRIAVQVLQSLAFLHSLGLVHSDLKPENILIKSYSRCEVKVIDLGSSCFITDHLSSYVQSRSYRAPEVILGLPYGQKIDIWSLGCILAELATGYVLFQNDSLATLLARLEGILGPLPSWMLTQGRYSNRYYTRSRQLYERNKVNGRYEVLLPKRTSLRHRVPAVDEGFLDFLSYLLTPDPSARPSAGEALQHPWLSYPYPPVEQIPD